MSIFIEYLFIICILFAYENFSLHLYHTLGVIWSKTLADVVDFITTASMAGWLAWNEHYILAAIGMTLWLKVALDKDLQKRLAESLEAVRKLRLDKKDKI